MTQDEIIKELKVRFVQKIGVISLAEYAKNNSLNYESLRSIMNGAVSFANITRKRGEGKKVIEQLIKDEVIDDQMLEQISTIEKPENRLRANFYEKTGMSIIKYAEEKEVDAHAIKRILSKKVTFKRSLTQKTLAAAKQLKLDGVIE